MSSPAPTTRFRRMRSVLVAVLSTAIGGVVVAPGVVAAPEDEVTITEGSLVWGFKESWRNYTGPGIPADDATQDADGITTWPLVDGTFDPADQVTRLSFGGSLHYQSHWAPDEVLISPPPGYTGPTDIYLLDVTLARPQVTISGTEQVLTMEATGRDLDTWLLVDYGRVAIATLDVEGLTPLVDGGTTAWSGIPAFIGEEARTGVFFDQYRPGQPLDPVSLAYAGPGGPPDFSEHWDPPGSTALAVDTNVLIGSNLRTYNVWAVDADDMVVHYSYRDPTGSRRYLNAFDLRTMTRVGEPLTFPGSLPAVAFVDTTDDRIFVRSPAGVVDTWYRWDATTQSYVSGTTSPVPLAGPSALWDPVARRAVSIERRLPQGSTTYEWYLHTHTEGEGGVWTDDVHPLPAGPASSGDTVNFGWYQRSFDAETGSGGAVLPDGSILLLRSVTGPEAPAQLRVQRLVIGDDAVTATEVPGTETTSSLGWGSIRRNAAGDVALLDATGAASVLNLRLGSDGALDVVGGPVGLGTMAASRMAIDPSDGTAWVRGAATQDLAAVRDGRLIYRRFHATLHPTQATIAVGDDHAVYTQTNDGTPPDLGGGTIYGFGRFERLGFSPTVTQQPVADVVTLPSAAATQEVSFSVAATADPPPTVRWQSKTLGASRFADIPGATAATLTVQATAADDGTEYRAVVSNAAGAIATDPATLSVWYPPSISFQPAPASVTEGDDATFQVQASGSPDPDIAWQTLTDGAWVDLPSESAAHTGEESNTLTLLHAALDQSGTQLRAKVSNTVATVFSNPVTLTVTGDGGSGPGEDEQEIVVVVPEPGPGTGELVWTISGTERAVALGAAEDRGDHWYAGGDLLPIVVADTRAGGPTWSISGQVSDFTGGVSGRFLGWVPAVLTPGAGAVAGDAVAPGFVSGDGLASPSVLASAPAGHESGSATVGAALDLRLPQSTPAGTYTATLTITALS